MALLVCIALILVWAAILYSVFETEPGYDEEQLRELTGFDVGDKDAPAL